MLGLKSADQSFKIILLFALLTLGVVAGVLIALYGFSPFIAAAPLALIFFILTINKPWIALMAFFLLIPLENLYVIEGTYSSTSTKLVGGYLVFLVLITGKFKYIPEIFKNKKALWIIGFGLASVVSILFSDISSALYGNLIRLFVLLSLYFVLTLMIRDITTLKYCLMALILGGALSVLSPLALDFESVGGSTLERYGGLWGDQNVFAAILLTILPMSLVFYLTERKRIYKLIFGAIFLILLVGFLLTYSRGGFLAFLVLILLTIPKVLMSKQRVRILALVIPIIIVLFSIFYITIADKYISRVETLRGLESENVSIIEGAMKRRYIYYFQVTPKLFTEDPIFGVGLGGFVNYNTIWKQNAHNTFLEVLTGTGLVGFIPFIMIIYLSWREMRRVQKASKHVKDLSLLYYYSTALELGFIALLVTSLFISLDFNKVLWLSITLSSVIVNILRTYTKDKAQMNTGVY